MQNLDKRISALEQASPSDRDTVIIICFQTPGDLGREIFSLEGDYKTTPRQLWTRKPNESEQVFTDRARKEVKRNEDGMAMLFQAD